MRALLLTVLVVSSGCLCGPTITEPGFPGEARVLVSEGGVLVESDTLRMVGAPGQVVTGRFTIQNVGNGRLIIEGVTATSGALVQLDATRLPGTVFAVGSIAGTLIERGGAFEIPITYLPDASGSTQTSVIELALDLQNGRKERRALTLIGRTYRTDCATISQGADLDFGRLAVGERADGRIVVRNDTNEVRTLAIGAYVSTSSAITLGSMEDLVLQPNTSQELAVHYAPTEERQEQVTFLLESRDACASQFVRLRGESVASGLTFDPTSVDFGASEPPAVVERSVIVRNRTSTAATLSDLETVGPFSVVTPGPFVVPAAGTGPDGVWREGVLTLTLRFSPSSLGSSTGRLTGRSSFPSQASFTLPLRGLGGSRRLCIESPLEFGKVPYFASRTPVAMRTLRLRSCGSLPVTVTMRPSYSLTAGDPHASVSELCVGTFDLAANVCLDTLPPELGTALPPGALVEVPVWALPANLMTAPDGLKSWSLTFFSDDTVSTTTMVRVTTQPVSVPPCTFGVTPAMVKFPMLEPGAMAVSNGPVQVCNLAPGAATGERCLVHSFQLTGAGFSAPSMPQGVVELAPQQCLSFDVHANATLPTGLKTGAITFWVSNPMLPRVTVPLSMEVGP